MHQSWNEHFAPYTGKTNRPLVAVLYRFPQYFFPRHASLSEPALVFPLRGLFEPPESVEEFRQLAPRICAGKLVESLLREAHQSA